jgi:uncharacterized protein (TIGR02145 family)
LTDPTPGALLDLNGTVRGGLLLSNVSLTNWCTVPDEIYEAAAINADGDKKTDFTGAMVYHTGTSDIPAGVYVWKGWRWISIGGDPIQYDAQGNDYTIGCFCDAGWWMTQNLRSTDVTYKSDDGTPVPLNPYTGSGSITEPQFTYPRVSGTWGSIAEQDRDSIFRAHPDYGLMYNWAAASGRTDSPGADSKGIESVPPEISYRGICPAGWHLPSDYEWSLLEKEMATNPGNYSSQTLPYSDLDNSVFFNATLAYRPDTGDSNGSFDTYWGRQMKSRTPVNGMASFGSSNGRDDNGFDALPMGYIDGDGYLDAIGTAQGYGSYADFWSGSSYSASHGIFRGTDRIYTGVSRRAYEKEYLYTIRCKKD